jgi:hypothetical protein
MARTMRWYNATGAAAAIDAVSGTNFAHWFGDAAHTSPILASGGLPTTGDTVYWDSSAANPADVAGNIYTWPGVNIAPGQSVYLTDSLGGAQFTMDAACQIAAGSSLTFVGGSMMPTLCATWVGDVKVNFSPGQPGGNCVLDAGWKVNGGAPGGNILVTDNTTYGINLIVNAPGAGQSLVFNTLSLAANTSNEAQGEMFWTPAPISITGPLTFQLWATQQWPSGNWITLLGPNASAFGVTSSGRIIGA